MTRARTAVFRRILRRNRLHTPYLRTFSYEKNSLENLQARAPEDSVFSSETLRNYRKSAQDEGFSLLECTKTNSGEVLQATDTANAPSLQQMRKEEENHD